MNDMHDTGPGSTRRSFLRNAAGALAIPLVGRLPGQLHHRPTARRVIYLCMSEGPSQLDLFDYKPGLRDRFDEDLPDSIRRGQRITTMTSTQKRFPVAPSKYAFARHGARGTWISELLPWTARMVDRLTIVRSMTTESINHDPGITFLQTGAEQPGRPSLGSWVSYGLGSENGDLPAYVVLHASWTGRKDAQALFTRLWGSGFLPTRHQGVALRAKGDPVLFLSDPPGVDRASRRRMLQSLLALNGIAEARDGDPEIATRSAQYELADRMQRSVPELVDLSDEPAHVLALYGDEVNVPGTFARSCLLARRMVERDVRFVQIWHRGWDQHLNLAGDLPKQCRDVDQPCFGLIQDLAQRGLLDDTLVVWGGEFGRTVYSQGPLSRDNYGRDHHPRCFTMWFAGGGIRAGFDHGATDDYSYNVIADPMHVHDLNATILHCLGLDHERLTYRFQGRDFRLTDVHGRVVREILA